MVPNDHLQSKISSITATASVSSTESHFPQSRSELDSHVNMVVLGKHCFVFDAGIHGKTCTVEPFNPSIGTAKKVPIVDAAIAYDCPYLHKTFLLIVRNALYIPSMLDHNLIIPPFILREAGLEVKDTPRSISMILMQMIILHLLFMNMNSESLYNCGESSCSSTLAVQHHKRFNIMIDCF